VQHHTPVIIKLSTQCRPGLSLGQGEIVFQVHDKTNTVTCKWVQVAREMADFSPFGDRMEPTWSLHRTVVMQAFRRVTGVTK
jgi:hypothetical protein